MALSLNIDFSKLQGAAADLGPNKAELAKGVQSAANAIQKAIQKTLRGRGSDYYNMAADATVATKTAEGYKVEIKHVGIGIHYVGTQGYLGHPIYPSGKTSRVTGEPIRALAIPTKNAPTKNRDRSIYNSGFRMGDLEFIPSKKGGNAVGVLVWTGTAQANKSTERSLKKKGMSRGEVMYVLIKEATIAPTPNILPTNEVMADAAALAFVKSINAQRK